MSKAKSYVCGYPTKAVYSGAKFKHATSIPPLAVLVLQILNFAAWAGMCHCVQAETVYQAILKGKELE